MSNDKLFNISNGYMLHCGIDCWKGLMEKEGLAHYIYLTTVRDKMMID